MSWKYFPSCQSVSQKVLTMFEKQLDGQMAPEKRDHGNLAVKARCFNFYTCHVFLSFGMFLQVYKLSLLNCIANQFKQRFAIIYIIIHHIQ